MPNYPGSNDLNQSLKGRLILDKGKLVGTFFARSVILICQHDNDGAFGLVLNRKTPHSVGDALVADLPETMRKLPIFQGGPVQQEEVCFLHSSQTLLNANVMPNLSLSHSIDILHDIGDSFASHEKVKVFAGYAGWAGGQLEDEMGLDTWTTFPASLDLVYSTQPEKLWQSIMMKKGGIYRLLAQSPEDPSLN